jgi:hypothetical protein
MTRIGIIGTLLLAGVIAYVVYQSMHLEAATCEVCIEYNGNTQCRTVSGPTLDDARSGAITNACAFLSSGVTDSMACGRTKPISENCR